MYYAQTVISSTVLWNDCDRWIWFSWNQSWNLKHLP